jgi:hypothetical protein
MRGKEGCGVMVELEEREEELSTTEFLGNVVTCEAFFLAVCVYSMAHLAARGVSSDFPARS